MEFLTVSENKLKIMLNSAEIEKYKLNSKELDYSDPELRNRFWAILDKAHEECGFSAKGEKVLIQFYPSKAGGEVFITKLGTLSKSVERSIENSGRVAMLESETKIYKFDDIYSAVLGIHTVEACLPDKMRAYLGDSGEVFMVFEDRNTKNTAVLYEFAKEIPNSIEFYIKEHAKKIEDPKECFRRLYELKNEDI